MNYEYPDSNTIIIKEKPQIFAAVILFFMLAGFVWFTYGFFPRVAEALPTSLEGIGEIFGLGRIPNLFSGDFSVFDLLPLLIYGVYLYFGILFLRMVISFVWMLIPRRTKIDGDMNKVSLPIRGHIYFENVESIYTRHIHDAADADEGDNMIMVGLRLTDGSKHFFGTMTDKVEAQKATERMALIMGKATEVKS